jgi:hypothetical protein
MKSMACVIILANSAPPPYTPTPTFAYRPNNKERMSVAAMPTLDGYRLHAGTSDLHTASTLGKPARAMATSCSGYS